MSSEGQLKREEVTVDEGLGLFSLISFFLCLFVCFFDADVGS